MTTFLYQTVCGSDYKLVLSSVGMGDAGFTSLAEAIMTGVFVDCWRLQVCEISGLINVIPLTNALRCGGLKSLTSFKFQYNEIEPEERFGIILGGPGSR